MASSSNMGIGSKSGDRPPVKVKYCCAVHSVGRRSGHRNPCVGGTVLAMKILIVDQDETACAEWARRLSPRPLLSAGRVADPPPGASRSYGRYRPIDRASARSHRRWRTVSDRTAGHRCAFPSGVAREHTRACACLGARAACRRRTDHGQSLGRRNRRRSNAPFFAGWVSSRPDEQSAPLNGCEHAISRQRFQGGSSNRRKGS